MYKTFVFFLILINFLTISAFNVQAQKGLTLRDAVKLALNNSNTLKVADQEILSAKKRNNKGEAGLYPTVTAGLNQSNNFSNINDPTSFVRGLFTNIGLNANLDANWVIFDGYKGKINKGILEKLEKRSVEGKKLQEVDVIERVMKAYVRAQVEQEKQKLWKEIIKLAETGREKEQLKNDLGATSKFEFLQVENAYLSDSTNMIVQRNVYEQSLVNLALAMEEDLAKRYFPTEKLRLGRSKSYQVENLKHQILSTNQEVLNQQLELDLLESEEELQKSNKMPRFTASAGFAYGLNRVRYPTLESQFGRNRDFYVNFNLLFNIFNGGAVKRNIELTKIQKDIGQLNLEGIQRNLSNSLQALLTTYKHQKQIVHANEKLMKNVQENLKLAEVRLQSGFTSYFEYRSLQLDYIRSVLAKWDAILAMKLTEVDLQKLTGGFDKWK